MAANARIKAWLVERDAAAIRKRYLPGANGRSTVAQGGSLQSAVRSRIADRAAALDWPKAPQQLHIFLAFALHNWEEVLPTALSAFGEVSVFEWHSRGFHESEPNWLTRRDAMNQEMLSAFKAANRRRPVDVVVGYLSGENTDPVVLREMRARGAVIVNFCFDDKIRWPGRRLRGRYRSTAALAQDIDLNLTSDTEGMAKYEALGGLSMFHAEAADPEWYKPLAVPFEHEVSFIGACYGWRPRFIQGLARLGVHVECFGSGWPNGAIDNADMNALYARSRINLGCGGIGFSRNLLCLKGRDFEVPMSGALYLTQNNPELCQVFDVGREILVYDDIGDCAQIIRELLRDEERAAQIRLAARARCLKDHTYETRWKHVFQTLGALTG